MQTIEVAVAAGDAAIPTLSLNSRIGLLRRRRRNNVLKQLLVFLGPLLVATTLLLLVGR